jgi:hypothetical protein
MAVLLTPPFLQFLDNNGNPLAGGKVFTYAAGTDTPKATFTTQAGDIANTNPVELDAAGRPLPEGSIWIEGSYKFVVTDADDVPVRTTDNVTSFEALPAANPAYFQTFSGNGSQTVFTTSENLGTESKAIFVWVDTSETDEVGYQIQNPSAYTIAGTTLTFATAPASGTNNIYVSAPSLLIGSASAAASNAAASAAAAAADAVLTAADVVTTNANVVLTNADAVSTAEDVISTAADAVSAEGWATGGTGGTSSPTNNAKYWSDQAQGAVVGDILPMTEQALTPSTPDAGVSKLYFKDDSELYKLNDAGNEERVGGNTQLLATLEADDDATVDITSLMDGTFPVYYVRLVDISPATNNARLDMLVSIDNGANFIDDAAASHHQTFTTSTTGYAAADSTGGVVRICAAVGNAAGRGASGLVKLLNPTSTTHNKLILSEYVYLDNSGNGVGSNAIAKVDNTSPINALRFAFSSGNIASGTFKLYGVL